MSKIERRGFLTRFSLAVTTLIAAPFRGLPARQSTNNADNPSPPMKTIRDTAPMGFQWECFDPFLFCAHHEDDFPKGNVKCGPAVPINDRALGDDFIIKDGFRMYHGKEVPGFPGHPHRGFETVTIVRKGMVDHADSLGAAGRYGDGDVQWMTAGKGVQHSEMFPLLKSDAPNPLELFQVWLNLPAKSKMVEPHFTMFWNDAIPVFSHTDGNGQSTKVEVIAGQLGMHSAPAPPPNSWAADPNNQVAIWNIKMEPGATWVLPKTLDGINRTLYYYAGDGLTLDETPLSRYHRAVVRPDVNLPIQNGNSEAGILMLQGRPIGERVMQYGPFVMNSKEEIQQAFEDYNRTRFGGWPWPRYDQVHPREKGRFALHADGREEQKG